MRRAPTTRDGRGQAPAAAAPAASSPGRVRLPPVQVRGNSSARPARRLRRAGALAIALSIAPVEAAGAPPVIDPEVQLLSPSTSQAVDEARPWVEVALKNGRVPAILQVDQVDVTALAERSAGRIRWRPEARLAPGRHTVKLVVADPEGLTRLEWTFTVAGEKGGPSREGLSAHSRGGLSLSGSQALAEQDVRTRTTATGNLGVTAGVSRGDLEASLAGSLGWFSAGPGQQVAPGGFVATLRKAEDSLAFGDVTFNGTPYTAPFLSRRGLLLTLNHLDATLQAFQVGSRSVRGLDAGVRFGDRGDQLYGAAVKTSFFRQQQLQVSAVFLQGRSSSGSSYNTTSIDGPSEGRVMGLQLAGTLLGTSVSAEGGFSDHDADTRDALGSKRDGAASVRLGRSLGPVSLSAAYEWVGPSYASIASPSTSRDRQQLGLSAGAGLGFVSLSASVSRTNDNVGHDAARPVVVSTGAGATLGLSPPGWPSLTLAYVRGMLGATDRPAGHPGVDTASDTATGALSFARGGYAASLSSSLSWLDDRRPGGLATAVSSVQLSGSVRPWKALSVAPSLAWADTRSGGVVTWTGLAALNLSATVVPRALTLSGQGSYARSRTSGDRSDVGQWGGTLRFGWEVGRLFERWFSFGTAILSASARYSRLQDRGPQPRESEVCGAFATLDLFLPLDARMEP